MSEVLREYDHFDQTQGDKGGLSISLQESNSIRCMNLRKYKMRCCMMFEKDPVLTNYTIIAMSTKLHKIFRQISEE
ncbi:hypothetical protein GCK32_010522, partial [Trichostrongylus colubriformis]